jgi:hypothetical protein
MIVLRHRPWLLLLTLALATAAAFLWSAVAVAQQPETPTELWQEYPLDPDPEAQQPAEDAPQAPSSRRGAGPAGDGEGEGAAAAAGEEQFPLVQVLVALGLLLLGVAHVVGVLARRGRVPERLHERIGAVRGMSPLSRPRPVYAARRRRTEFLAQGTEPRPSPTPLVGGGGKRAEVAAKPARPPKPEAPPAAPKRPSVQKPPARHTESAKPPPAKPAPAAKPVKPTRASKPTGAAKPAQPVKPTRASKPTGAAKPAQPAKPPSAKPAKAARRPKPVQPAKPVRAAEDGASAVAKKPVSTAVHKPKPPTRQEPPVEVAPAREEPRPVAADTLTVRKLTCSIFGWRDGTQADYYALASGLQGHDWIVERSPRFEWLVGDLPVEAYEAHAMLIDALVRAGWRHVGSEGVWYRQRFERPVDDSDAEGSEP